MLLLKEGCCEERLLMNWNKHLLNNRQFLSIVALAGCVLLPREVILPGQVPHGVNPPRERHTLPSLCPSAWPLHTDHLALLDRYVKGETAFLA